MRDNIIKYLHKFNEIANVQIEYATLEQVPTTNGEDRFNLYVVYTPKLTTLLAQYTSVLVLDATTENKSSCNNEFITLLSSFVSKDNFQKLVDIDSSLLSSINTFIISNIAKLCNFTLQSSSEPFLAMFLEERNIIWKTHEFDLFFFAKKETYKPTKILMARALHLYFKEILKNTQEYAYTSNRDKMSKLYERLFNLTKLFLIWTSYSTTDTLSSVLTEDDNNILNTLFQASKPWEYASECLQIVEKYLIAANTIISSIGPINGLSLNLELKQQVINFLAYRVTTETL